MIEMRRASTRMKSLRSLIAIGGAAAMAFGLAQASGTLANPTDVVNSTGAQVATGNFYPTPLTAGPISCWYEAPWYDSVVGRRVSYFLASSRGCHRIQGGLRQEIRPQLCCPRGTIYRRIRRRSPESPMVIGT